jgi:hypothetical protein
MSPDKHTPGPWETKWDGTIGRPARVVAWREGFGTVSIPAVPADSAVMAAAPDLLRVARDWLHTMEADRYDCCCEYEVGDVEEVVVDQCPLCRCKDAIEKATGVRP